MPPEEGPREADDRSNYTVKEILDWLVALDATAKPEAQRIEIAARTLARLTGATAQDLKQEAFTRLFERRRLIGRQVPIHAGFIGVMRSIASEEAEHRRRFISDEGVSAAAEVMFKDSEPTPQDQALWRHYWPRLVKLLEQEFADKPLVRDLLRVRLCELAGAPGKPNSSLNNSQRPAATKLLQRRLVLVREKLIDAQTTRVTDKSAAAPEAAMPTKSDGGL